MLDRAISSVSAGARTGALHYRNFPRALTASDKRVILDNLGGFCRYDDWDQLEASLDDRNYEALLRNLTAAVITKHIYETVITNPFSYIELEENSTTVQSSMDPPVFKRGLYELWQRFSRVDGERARNWRQTTIQLLNQSVPSKTNDWRVTYWTQESQEPLFRRLASGMLEGCQALHILMREITDPAEIKKRYKELVDVYRNAIDLVVYMGRVDPNFEFHLDAARCGSYLHCKNRVKKKGCPEREPRHDDDDDDDDDCPQPVMILRPLVVTCRQMDEGDVEYQEELREIYRLEHEDETGEDIEKKVEEAHPKLEVGDTRFDASAKFPDIYYAKDKPRPCTCGGRFTCFGLCQLREKAAE
ncbi:hypothetical protein BO70DRAFT_417159 [Aspergillus heteromorphus CBS 117.55]|uniref:Uncharacterized protein n=1 Tax=Aspergillus heteromorphus CBS 117.55 TaxID=1448321 RepID=A0A317V2U6_9EURO|nr:uncharacterized protein BO70DRAFT_417159 [Aspergillus heteromorphus CBS 117.55]PWY68604.1 hypothetical protein BO70DRAFT_417159 [Aspergillus heteromorphus CBS 117.55]